MRDMQALDEMREIFSIGSALGEFMREQGQSMKSTSPAHIKAHMESLPSLFFGNDIFSVLKLLLDNSKNVVPLEARFKYSTLFLIQ